MLVDTAMLLGAKNKTQVEAEMWDVIALEAQITVGQRASPYED